MQKVCMRWQQIVSDFSLYASLSLTELDKLYNVLPEAVVDQFILIASYEDLTKRQFCKHSNEERWERLCHLKIIPEEEQEASNNINNNNNKKNTIRKNAKVTWKQFFTEYVRKTPPVCEYCKRPWIPSLLRVGIK